MSSMHLDAFIHELIADRMDLTPSLCSSATTCKKRKTFHETVLIKPIAYGQSDNVISASGIHLYNVRVL